MTCTMTLYPVKTVVLSLQHCTHSKDNLSLSYENMLACTFVESISIMLIMMKQ